MIDDKSYRKMSHLVRSEGEHNSRLMYKFPTSLESRVRDILDRNKVKYSFQKLFYRTVEGYRQYTEAYYIANFWLPGKRLMIDVEPAPRKVGVKSEGLRTFSNDRIYPRAQVLKITERDLDYPSFTAELLAFVK